MRDDHCGQAGLVLVVIVVIAFIVLAAILWVFLAQPSGREELCGSTTEDLRREWVQVVLDSTTPAIENVVAVANEALDTENFLSTIVLIAVSEGRELAYGKAHVVELAGHFFLGFGLYIGCNLAGFAAQGYREELGDNAVKLGVLLALNMVAPSALDYYPTIEFLIDMVSGSDFVPAGPPTIKVGPYLDISSPSAFRPAFPPTIETGMARESTAVFRGTFRIP